MDALTDFDRHIDEGEGTPESAWLAWPGLATLPGTTWDTLVPEDARAWVVAPHPDDEVLSVGGLLAELAHAGREAGVVAVTDGEASHPGSGLWSAQQLAAVRRAETAEALARLGLTSPALRLGLPDGGVQQREDALAAQLAGLLHAGDVVFTTWRLDGHPDHEATGRACAVACHARGARLFEVPVWAWHWASPGDPRLPWGRACRLELGTPARQAKRDAVSAFRSQLLPDPSTGASPILRGSTVARAARSFEVLFTENFS